MVSAVATAAKTSTSAPSSRGPCPGISAAAALTTISTSEAMVAAARDVMLGMLMIVVMFTVIATMIRPASAPAAPAVATKKSLHPAGISSVILVAFPRGRDEREHSVEPVVHTLVEHAAVRHLAVPADVVGGGEQHVLLGARQLVGEDAGR